MGTLSAASLPIRVFITDDTPIVRETLAREITQHTDIQLIGTAAGECEAIQKISRLKPDVIILDIEIPTLDLSSFLNRFLAYPVIALTSSSPQGAAIAMDALAAGAVDVIYKPQPHQPILEVAASLVEKIRAARGLHAAPLPQRPVKMRALTRQSPSDDTILAIGAAAGSIEALDEILAHLPPDSPGAIVVHHLPARITSLLADRLNQVCDIEVKEAADGDTLLRGRALIAPGGHHTLLRRSATHYYVELKDGPHVHHQKPSIDVLFNSLAKLTPQDTIAALLSGSDSDGTQGLTNLRHAGARTLATTKCPAAEQVVPNEQLAHTLIELIHLRTESTELSLHPA